MRKGYRRKCEKKDAGRTIKKEMGGGGNCEKKDTGGNVRKRMQGEL